VTELTHDVADDGFHEIQLSGKQIVFLIMVLTVASAVIFLTGVLVGRGVRFQRAEAAEQSAAVTAAPPAAQPADAAQPSAEPPPAPAETPDELSYHKRLQGDSAPADQVKPDAAPAASKPTPPPPAPAAVPAPAKPEDVPTGGKPGAWVVQVVAVGNADAARNVVRRLTEKGYPAFLVNPAPGMPSIYRVQIGGYPTRGDADQVARRVEKEDQFKPVVRQNR
jgi:cell division septation protein DedD